MSTYINDSHRAHAQERTRIQSERDAEAERIMRHRGAWGVLLSRGTPRKGELDFSGVENELEARWLRAGGELSSYRQIFSDEAEESIRGLMQLETALGVPESERTVKLSAPVERVRGPLSHFRPVEQLSLSGLSAAERVQALGDRRDTLAAELRRVDAAFLRACRDADLER